MKRFFLCAGLALTMTFFTRCAQHDTKSPDTSGSFSKDQPGVGVDTSNVGIQNNGNNASNDGTNNNQQINTGDTGTKKQ